MDVKDAKVAQWVKECLLAGKFGNYTGAARSAGNQRGWSDEQKEEGRTLARHYFSSKGGVKRRKAPPKKVKKPSVAHPPASTPAAPPAPVVALSDLSAVLAEGFKGVSDSINMTLASERIALNELAVKLDLLLNEQHAARAQKEATQLAQDLASIEARPAGPVRHASKMVYGTLSEGRTLRRREGYNFAPALIHAPSYTETVSQLHRIAETMQLLQSLGLSSAAREKVQGTFAEVAPLLAEALLSQVKRSTPLSGIAMKELLGASLGVQVAETPKR